MKNIKNFITALLCSIVALACDHSKKKEVQVVTQTIQDDGSKIFRGLVMRGTPYADITPKSEVREGQATPAMYYKAKYDERGRLTSLEHHAQGDLTDKMMYKGNGYLSYGSPDIRISYKDNKEIREYFDKHGEPMRNGNGVFKDEFLLDYRGYRAKLQYYDSLGNRMENYRGVFAYEWETNEDGTLVVEKRTNKSGELVTLSNFMDFLITHMTFENGFRTGFINYGSDGVKEVESNGRKISRTQVTWDARGGNELKIEFLGLDGKLKNLEKLESAGPGSYGYAIESYDWDRLGNQIGFRTVDENNQLINRPDQNFAYQYFPADEHGLTHKIVHYDQGMYQAKNHRGVYQVQHQYDSMGNLVKMINQDTYGVPMMANDGVAITKLGYDDQNRLVQVEFYDEDGAAVENKGSFSTVKISYDANGARKFNHYNLKNELVESR